MPGFERLAVPMNELARLGAEAGVRELAVFGSVLREDFHADSDVDLLVEFEAGRRVSLFDLLELQQRLEDLIGRPVDLVPRQGLKPLIRDHVLAEARTVYAA
jgi:predicted nucleotidyltransferase